jgi:hypothetical protein
MAHAVLVLEGALEDVGEDLHVAVRVGGEAAAGGDAVLVDDPELAEAHVVGIVVLAERERVAVSSHPKSNRPRSCAFLTTSIAYGSGVGVGVGLGAGALRKIRVS